MPRRASLTVIEAQIRELEAKADAIKNAEKPGIKQLKAVIQKFKLSAADVAHVAGGRAGTRNSTLAGIKVKPKYRNPTNRTETWSGRGLRPRWLVAAMKGGKKLEDFAI
jgi:DNA-binding protein H-NS